jgi:hypothetical protein
MRLDGLEGSVKITTSNLAHHQEQMDAETAGLVPKNRAERVFLYQFCWREFLESRGLK